MNSEDEQAGTKAFASAYLRKLLDSGNPHEDLKFHMHETRHFRPQGEAIWFHLKDLDQIWAQTFNEHPGADLIINKTTYIWTFDDTELASIREIFSAEYEFINNAVGSDRYF